MFQSLNRLATSISYPKRAVYSNAGKMHRDMSTYMAALCESTRIAKPDKWLSLLDSLSLTEDHPWFQGGEDYSLVIIETDLTTALDEGLLRPILIPSESLLRRPLLVRNSTSDQVSFEFSQLLDRVLEDDGTVSVQDQGADDFQSFTIIKTGRDIKEHFAASQRTAPWNCLEVGDTLFSTFTGPEMLESLDFLNELQSRPRPINSTTDDMGRTRPNYDEGAKRLDRWLLISEAESFSTAHVDVTLATYIRVVRGKKIFWFRTELTSVDESVWRTLQDPRLFSSEWAAIELHEGDTL